MSTYLIIAKHGIDYYHTSIIHDISTNSTISKNNTCIDVKIINDNKRKKNRDFVIMLNISSNRLTINNSKTIVTIIEDECESIIITAGSRFELGQSSPSV